MPDRDRAPGRLRVLGRGVRAPDSHGVRDAAEPAVRAVPNVGRPLRLHDHRGLRDLRGRRDRHAARGQLPCGARRTARRDARRRGDDDGGGAARGLEGSARTAGRAPVHRGGGRAGRRCRDPVPHRVAPARGSESIHGPRQEHRHRGERRRARLGPLVAGCLGARSTWPSRPPASSCATSTRSL